jgi:hypothetical protein
MTSPSPGARGRTPRRPTPRRPTPPGPTTTPSLDRIMPLSMQSEIATMDIKTRDGLREKYAKDTNRPAGLDSRLKRLDELPKLRALGKLAWV